MVFISIFDSCAEHFVEVFEGMVAVISDRKESLAHMVELVRNVSVAKHDARVPSQSLLLFRRHVGHQLLVLVPKLNDFSVLGAA